MTTLLTARSSLFALAATCLASLTACGASDGEDDRGVHRSVEPAGGPDAPGATAGTPGGTSTAPGPGAGEPGAPRGPGSATDAIAGKITIRSAPSVYVFLGDGSTFAAQVPASGEVTFTDPSIVGPQNVTSFSSSDTATFATTLVAIDRNDVSIAGNAFTHSATSQATVQGMLRGLSPGAGGSVLLYGGGMAANVGFSALGGTDTTHAFSISLPGSAPPTTVRMIGATREDGDLLRVGATLPIAVPASKTVAQDLTLDRACDRGIAVALQNFSAFGSDRIVTLSYTVEGSRAFSVTKSGALSSVSFAAFSLASPFEDLRPVVQARSAGSSSSTVAEVPVPSGEGAVIATGLGSAPLLTSPATQPAGTDGAGPSASLAPGTQVAWTNVDPAAAVVEVKVSAMVPNPYVALEWTFIAPADVTSLTIPELGTQAATRRFPSGSPSASVTVTQHVYDASVPRAAVFGRTAREVDDVVRTSGRRSSTFKGELVTP
jgi:hypothetical protein